MLRHGITGDWIGTFTGHKGAVWCTSINKGATVVATASADYSARVWSAITGEELHSFVHSKIVKAVDLSENGERLVTGGLDPHLRIFDLQSGSDIPVLTLDGHIDGVRAVHWAEEDQALISMGADGHVLIWDVRSCKQVRQLTTSKSTLCGLSLDMGGTKLTGVGNKCVTVWDVGSYEESFSIEVAPTVTTASVLVGNLHGEGNENNVVGRMEGESDRLVVTGGNDNWVRLYDDKGTELELQKGHHGPVHCVRFAPDGNAFGSSSDDGTIRLWLTQNKSYGLWQLGSTNSLNNAVEGSSSSSNVPIPMKRSNSHSQKISPQTSRSSKHISKSIGNVSGWGSQGNLSNGSGYQARKSRRRNTAGKSPGEVRSASARGQLNSSDNGSASSAPKGGTHHGALP